MDVAGRFAARYFFSRKSHAVINLIAGVSVLSVAVPVAAMIVLLSVFNGFEELARTMTTLSDADLTLTPARGATFRTDTLDAAALRAVDGVEEIAFALEQEVLVEYRGRQTTATLRGVDAAYARTVPLAEATVHGTWLTRDTTGRDFAVAGQGIAYALGLRTLAAGENELTLYALRRTSFSPLLPVDGYARRRVPAAGIFALDAETDSRLVVASIELARELFDYAGRASAAAVRLAPGASPEAVARRVAAEAGEGFVVRTREQMNEGFYRIMRFEKWGVFFISLLVMAVASFSIVGTLTMLILDKRPSFVTLRAMGADRRLLRAIFEREGWLIGGIGAAAGTAAGVGLCLAQQHFGFVGMPAGSFLIESYPVRLQPGDLGAVALAFTLLVGTVTRLTVRKTIRS